MEKNFPFTASTHHPLHPTLSPSHPRSNPKPPGLTSSAKMSHTPTPASLSCLDSGAHTSPCTPVARPHAPVPACTGQPKQILPSQARPSPHLQLLHQRIQSTFISSGVTDQLPLELGTQAKEQTLCFFSNKTLLSKLCFSMVCLSHILKQ